MKESNILEFKESINNHFLKTVSAFANQKGGTILFGVTDEGKEVGLDRPHKLKLDIENKINDSISPKPDFKLTINSKSVIVLEVLEGEFKPYLYKAKAYKRNDTSTIEIEGLELRRLILESTNLSFEELPCVEGAYEFKILEAKFKENLNIEALNSDHLKTLGFYDKKMNLNNAAALMADSNSFSGIDIAVFGRTINEILHRRTFSNSSLLKLYDEAIAMYKQYYEYELIEGFERKKIQRIPEEAYREALANALVHRNWDTGSHIKISMFSDRIVIDSPGGLPAGMKEETYLMGSVSALRNPIIANIFFRLDYIETFGTGIKRIKLKYKNAALQPEFMFSPESVSVILPVFEGRYDADMEEQLLLDLLKIHPHLSSSEMENLTGLKKNKVLRLLNSLIDKKYVIATGRGRATKYKLRV